MEFVGAQNDIGHILAGEWVEYTIDVPAGGTYALSVNAKTPIGGNTIAVSVEGGPTLATFALPDSNGGDTSFAGTVFAETPSQNIVLGAGEQTLRFTFDGSPASNGYVADFRAFTLEEVEVDGQTPFPGPDAPELGDILTVDALNYDDGGQGIAYNDAPGLAGGTNGGRAGSDVEVTANGDIGWIEDDEWLEYTIDVADAGSYDIDILMATNAGGRSVTASAYLDGASTPYTTTGSIANPSTGSYTTFADRSGVLDLDEGEQVIRITFDGGSQDFRSFTLTDADLLA